MDSGSRQQRSLNPSNGKTIEKPKVVVIMGPTGSGKSKLAIDLASHFPVEVINADSMQVYQGLDVLTNKVPPHEQKGVPHHLLGTVSPNIEFTAKEFRDSAIPLITDILSRNQIPVIVGGTNYYIQALVSPFLLDDSTEDVDESCYTGLSGDEQADLEFDSGRDDSNYRYEDLQDLDPVAANRIHPNNQRKINQYISLYARSGVLPSKLFQGKAAENWGRVDKSRFNCCFICVDAATPVLDRYVEQRVDCMIDAGLLDEVYDIYNVNGDYTRGLRQAIGVREFEEFLKMYLSTIRNNGATESIDAFLNPVSTNTHDETLKEHMRAILKSSGNNQLKILLEGAIDKVKLNTRRLIRIQKRRLNRLQTLYEWNIHYVDSMEAISCKSDESWAADVVGPAVNIITTFLSDKERMVPKLEDPKSTSKEPIQRDLWTQYTCKACGDKVLRGAHEWEQHQQGRRHRKRISQLRKSQAFCLAEQRQPHSSFKS
ncbi:tRNA dimethylallyltransferase 2 isoform X2 [Mangifera indica]|uniref:tRNA dimethylallyltransferase 2 isoform X2 n=1 Tax=Mangifera indica TaxID=29780 RepID=UPI001CFA96EA|nr:tRNA dimethylallyltransferase 2 isoform X2 [Mangifera indica]